MTGSLAAACAAAVALALLAAAPGPPAPVPTASPSVAAGEGYSTWLERVAPAAFDHAVHPTLGGLRVAYRLDAQVLLPLVVTSLELFSKPDVGFASASYRDSRSADGERLRAFEFFATSNPERARGIDRMGFFREAARLNGQGVDWTAYFGTMTLSPEQTLAQAEGAVKNGKKAVAYEVTDGFSSARETVAGVFEVEVDRRGTNADELYETVRPKLGGRAPRYTRSVQGSTAALPPLAFLGALQVSLREAAATQARPQQGKVPRVGFVHNGVVRYLVVEEVARDDARGREAVAGGFARNAARVYRLDFRIINPGTGDGAFRLWAELPSVAGLPADAVPIPPIAFELTPRSFLRLHFSRTK